MLREMATMWEHWQRTHRNDQQFLCGYTSNISGNTNSETGGLIGENDGTISNSYSAGGVQGNNTVGAPGRDERGNYFKCLFDVLCK